VRILITLTRLNAGGVQRSVASIVPELSRKGHSVVVHTLSQHDDDFFALPPDVHRITDRGFGESQSLLRGTWTNVHRVFRLVKHVKRYRPDVLIAHEVNMNVLAIAAGCLTRTPVVVCEHSDPARATSPRQWDLARRLLYRRAEVLVVPATSSLCWANRISRSKALTIPNAIDDRFFGTRAVGSDRVIVAAGRFVPSKAFDLLVRAFAASGVADRGWSLHLFGEGAEQSKLEALVWELDLAASVSVHPPTDALDAVFSRASVLACTSEHEGFGLVLLEAMAAGLPVVAAPCSGAPNTFLRHGHNCLISSDRSVQEVAAVLIEIVNDGSLRANLAEKGRETAAFFRVENVCAQWVRILESVTASTR
jgi:GalNAc-alpha-(1->4)-GalNAc-alpha-(1->3)-diNAcBac-PP-undecaprenol alpha-1,4-N-acetyl-D-galactosaminyltransferase